MTVTWDSEQSFEEEGAGTIGCTWLDEDGAAETPTAIIWSLFDEGGTIVNSLEDESIVTPATTNYINLDGDDLKLPDSKKPWRTLFVDATYDSTYGNGRHLIGNLKFMIKQVTGKP